MKFAKVMFSHVSVCTQWGNTWAGTTPRQVHLPRQVHPQAGTTPRRYTHLGGTSCRQVHPTSRYTPWIGTCPQQNVNNFAHSGFRGDVTRSPNKGISGPTKRTHVLQKINRNKIKYTINLKKIVSNWLYIVTTRNGFKQDSIELSVNILIYSHKHSVHLSLSTTSPAVGHKNNWSKLCRITTNRTSSGTKVMFLQVSVCPQGGGDMWQRACMVWWGHAYRRDGHCHWSQIGTVQAVVYIGARQPVSSQDQQPMILLARCIF